jgi:hypothetical protein
MTTNDPAIRGCGFIGGGPGIGQLSQFFARSLLTNGIYESNLDSTESACNVNF